MARFSFGTNASSLSAFARYAMVAAGLALLGAMVAKWVKVEADFSAFLPAAADALRELRRLQPGLSLGWIAKEMPIKEAIDLEHYLEGFRRAGLV